MCVYICMRPFDGQMARRTSSRAFSDEFALQHFASGAWVMYVYVYIYVQALYIHVCVCICIYIYIHTYIYIYV